MPSPSPLAFLSLPRELRDTIYHHYVFEADGYHFDYESGKLRASGNRPIHLALMYTCTSVAAEMHHLALGSNVLNFSTSANPSETERRNAARFDMSLSRIQSGRSDALTAMGKPEFLRYKTSDVDAEIALRYPPFEPLLHQLYDLDGSHHHGIQTVRDGGSLGSSWGQPDSVFRAFQRDMIELLSRDTDFPDALANSYDGLPIRTDISLYPDLPIDEDSDQNLDPDSLAWYDVRHRNAVKEYQHYR
ncbi:MAG: hypothetical protein Q9196_007154, partial [Gyalolechia fulgens]